MQTLNRLCTTARTVLFTSIPALTQRVLPALVFTDAILQFQPNGSLEREVLVSSLLRLGYRKGSVVEIPGEFSIRGGIVDIYSTAYADPYGWSFSATRSSRSASSIRPHKNRPTRSNRPGCCRPAN